MQSTPIVNKESIKAIIENLSEMRHPLGHIKNNLLMASKAADYAIRLLSGVGGKIFHIFTNESPYKTILSSEPGKTILSSNSTFYLQKAERCCKLAVTYTMFLFSSCASDVVTLSDLTRSTWGELYLYTHLNHHKFYYDLIL